MAATTQFSRSVGAFEYENAPGNGGASDGSTTYEDVTTTTYTITNADANGITKRLTNVAGCVVTYPAGLTWTAGQRVEILDVSGLSTFADDGTSVLTSLADQYTSAGAGAKTVIECTGTNTAKLYGEYGGTQVSFTVAVGDETTALTTGAGKITFRMPFAMTLTSVRASVVTAPTGANLIVDINDGGTSIMTTTKLSIDISEKTSTTAANPPAITDTELADDAEITIDVDQIGSTIAGAGLKVTFYGTTP